MSAGTEIVSASDFMPAHLEAEIIDVAAQVARAQTLAEGLRIDSEDDAAKATELLREVKRRQKAAEEARKAMVKPRNDAVKEINERFKAALKPIAALESVLRDKVQVWTARQEFLALEAEAWAENERRDREAAVRKQREAAEDEARAAEEAARQEAREAAELAAEDDDPELEELADELREDAQVAATAADAIAALPEVSLPVPVAQAPAKPEGVVNQKRWQVKAIDASRLPAEYLIPDEKAIKEAMRQGVKETGRPPEIPGVVFEQVPVLAVRT